MDAHGYVGYIARMQLLSGKAAAEHISGILHPKYQVHGFSVHLTARNDFIPGPHRADRLRRRRIHGRGPHGNDSYTTLRLEDRYLWWDLSRGSYFVQCNETLHLAPNELALIEPEDRLLRAGASHVPLFVRGHIDPVELLLNVGVLQLRVKENARIARVRVFRIDEARMRRLPGTVGNSKKPKRAQRKSDRVIRSTHFRDGRRKDSYSQAARSPARTCSYVRR